MSIQVAGVALDTAKRECSFQGRSVTVEPLVCSVLELLLENVGSVVTKDALIARVWQHRAVSDSAITRAVSLARRALRTVVGVDSIAAVYGTGYRLAIPEDPTCTLTDLSGASQPFIGRAHELSLLDGSLDRAETGLGALHLITGPPGIGKSRLLLEATSRARARGFHVRQGRCAESGGAPPLWPWIEILRQELQARGWPPSSRIDAAPIQQLKGLLGFDSAKPDSEARRLVDSDGDRFSLFDAIGHLLSVRAQQAPMLLALDDLHRSDLASLALLRFLLDQLPCTPLVILGAYRDAEGMLGDTRRHLRSLASRGTVFLSALAGLSAREVESFVRSRGLKISPSDLYSQSGGNPLFLHHLATLLHETRLPKNAAPSLLAEAIAEHVSLVSLATRETLATASVIGRDFERWLLQGLTNGTDEQARHLEEATKRGLLMSETAADGRELYRFAHDLVRDQLYNALNARERAEIHLTVAKTLQESNAAGRRISEVAHHYRLALPYCNVADAARASCCAAIQATSRYAYEEAATLFEQALAMTDVEAGYQSLRADCLIGLAEARNRMGDREGAWESCQAAAVLGRDLESADILGRAALSVSPGFLSIETSYYNQAHVSLIAEAIGCQGQEPTPMLVLLWSQLALALHWSDRELQRREASERAIELANQVGGRAERAKALFARHSVLSGADWTQERARLASELVDVASACNDQESVLLYQSLLITDLAELGDFQDLEKEVFRFRRTADRVRQPDSVWLSPMFAGMLALLHGQFREAEALSSELKALGDRVGSEDAANCWTAQTVLRRFETGGGPQIIEALLRHSQQHPNVLRLFRTAPAWAAAEFGLDEEARTFLAAFSSSGFQCLPRDMNWLGSMTILAMASAELRDVEACQDLFELLEPYASRFALLGYCAVGFGSVAAHVARLAAVLGREGEADHYFALGLSRNAEAGARPWVVRCRYARGSWLREMGQQALGRKDLGAAAAEADRLGMTHMSDRCRSLLGEGIPGIS